MPSNLEEVFIQFERDEIKFHTRADHELFKDALQCFETQRYGAAAMTGICLFERVFSGRLIRETAFPKDFIPSKTNTDKQLKYRGDREIEVGDGEASKPGKKGMDFYDITEALQKLNILSENDKVSSDSFYRKYRIPMSHGIFSRLYEVTYNRKPTHTFEVDSSYDDMFKQLSIIIIEKIYDLHLKGIVLKQGRRSP